MRSFRYDRSSAPGVVALAVGDVISMRLIAHSGGGFRWQVTEASDDFVKVTRRYRHYDSTVGSPQESEFTILAKKPGAVYVTFKYSRSWMDEVEDSFQIELRIQ